MINDRRLASLLVLLLLFFSTVAVTETGFLGPSMLGLRVASAANSASPSAIHSVLNDISSGTMRIHLTNLVGFGNRHTMSTTTDPERGIGAAREYILRTFESFGGRLQVAYDSYKVKGDGRRISRDVDLRNVVATLPGSNSADRGRILMVGGHYDSLAFRPQDSEIPLDEFPMPGANDDGSGTIVTMELARVMAGLETEATVMFVAFAGEELGLVGSTLMAQRMAAEGADVEAMITNDIVGSPVGGDGQVDSARVRIFSAGPADSLPRSLARYMRSTAALYLPAVDVDTIFRYDRFGRGGDHTPFVQEGYAGVRVTESHEFYERQHTTRDLIDYVDFDYMATVARVNGAMLASLANAPSPPRVNDERGRPMLSRGNTGYAAHMYWESNPEPDVARYAVWMRRTTSPFWEREFDVGAATELLLSDVSIDDWTFGVQAIDTDGNRSLVSAYVYPLRGRRTYKTVEH